MMTASGPAAPGTGAPGPGTGAPGGARHTVLATWLGELTVIRCGALLTGLYFPHHWHRPDPASLGPRDDTGFAEVIAQLTEYLDGTRTRFDLPLEPHGTPFQHQVWDLIAQIPYGQTATYGSLARQLGGRLDAREVGAATGRNPLSILIPCHRVVGRDGQLTGYAGGLRRKRRLLDLERAHATTEHGPVAATLW